MKRWRASEEPPRAHASFGVLIFLLGATLLLVFGLSVRDPMNEAELRLVMVAEDILDTGRWHPPWLEADALEGRPYLNKPPLAHGLVALAMRALGRDDAVPRIPSVLAGIGCLLLVFLLAQERFGRRSALWSGVFLLSGWLFFERCRRSQLEMLQTATFLLVIWGLARARTRPETCRRWLFVAAVGAALSSLTKGPVLALLFPAFWIVAEALCARPGRRVGPALRDLACVGAGSLLAAAVYYVPLLETYGDVLRDRALGGNAPHHQPFHFYAFSVPKDLAPGILLAPYLWVARREVWNAAKTPLVAWALGFLVFSMLKSKQDHYLLPLHPLLALPMGFAVALGTQAHHRLGLFLTSGSVVLALPLGLLVLQTQEAEFLATHGWVFGVVALAVSLGAWSLWRLLAWRVAGPLWRDQALAAAALLVAVAGAATTYDAFRTRTKSPRPALSAFRETVAARPVGALDDHLAIPYYLGRKTVNVFSDPKSAARSLEEPSGAYLILQKRRKDPLPSGLEAVSVRAVWRSPNGRSEWILLEGR